ncbi:MAG: Secretion system C-terminal sorting domain [Bacteroidota bacterium]|jgi:hypothetical protein
MRKKLIFIELFYYKYLLLFFIFIFNFSTYGKAQITLENTYNSLQDQANNVFITNIGNNNFKYVVWDIFGNRFSLFNIDHTPYMQNIQIPAGDSGQFYSLGYITNSLFDCDSSNIEYALIGNYPNPAKPFLIYRTDGTLVFSRDSATTAFCLGCLGGSQEILGIVNTPEGTKLNLITYNYNNHSYDNSIYSLCGKLPETTIPLELGSSNVFVKVFPNPASNNIQFQITCPNIFEEFDLVIFDSQSKRINSSPIKGIFNSLSINCENFADGTYFYSLQNKDKVFQTGKFIKTK